VESLGARFKRERERQGMTLDDVALATKIGTRMLQAIEQDEFNRLPGGIFNKGFIRSYARHLGLDEEQALADYLAATGGPPAEKAPEVLIAEIAARAEESREDTRSRGEISIPWGKLAIVLLVVALGLVLWGSRDSGRHSQEARPRRTVNSAAVMQSGPSGAAAGGEISAAPSSLNQPAASSAAATSNKPGYFSLRIRAREDCWLTITADGKEVAHELLAANSEKSVEAQQTIVVRAGNVGGLDFWFNGQKLASQGETEEVKTLVFGADGLQTAAAKAVLPAEPGASQP
jgi:cytoskeleton protein RodZ